MKNFQKQIEFLKLKNENIFDSLFSSRKKTDEPIMVSDYIKVLPNGEYEISGNPVKKIYGVTLEGLKTLEFLGAGLECLIHGKYTADYVHIELGTNSIFKFEGVWKSGNFKGENFYGQFQGGTFQGGNFGYTYDNWKTTPAAFIDGTVDNYLKGVLGVKKAPASFYDKTTSEKKVNLLEVPLGYYVNFKDHYGNNWSFKIEKLVDSSSSDVIIQEENGDKNKLVITWDEFRGSDNFIYSQMFFENRINIEVGKKLLIPQLFDGKAVGVIENFEISPKGNLSSVTTAANKVEKLDLSLLKPLSFTTVSRSAPIIKLYFPNIKDHKAYQKILNDIQNNLFEYHVKNIANGLQTGLIKQIYSYPYLYQILVGVVTNKSSFSNREKEKESLEWLEKFAEVVINNIVKNKVVNGNYESNEALKKQIINKLRVYFEPYITSKVVPVPPKSKAKPIV